jgi:hypothetical protein
MNLSQYSQNMLSDAFPTSLGDSSWPTYLSMSCEESPKPMKKSFKNQSLGILG